MTYGPTNPLSEKKHSEQMRLDGETFRDAMARIAGGMAENDEHFHKLFDILLNMRFVPNSRVQAAIGSTKIVTPFACFVGGGVIDSIEGIMQSATECAIIQKLGGGWGEDFSTVRGRDMPILSQGTKASGAVSFMAIPNAVSETIRSAGNRRGAMMAVLRIDHPDIEEFIAVKTREGVLTNFNLSVAVTDDFMRCLKAGTTFPLKFNGVVVKQVNPRALWDKLMRANWDWGEPGVLFIDAINRMNNLSYCEVIHATNPCAEEPLPPHGCCFLGSLNLVKYLTGRSYAFDFVRFQRDIQVIVRGMDNIIDDAVYPLPQHKGMELATRRMGIGVMGLANAIEMLGHPYGSKEFLEWMDHIMERLVIGAYSASVQLAREKGSFPRFNAEKYCASNFIRELPKGLIAAIHKHGIRNSHLISFAPTGTIAYCSDHVSSGIEPVFAHQAKRIVLEDGVETEYDIEDYAYTRGVLGRTSAECSIEEHLNVLVTATRWSDSSVSKTINVGENVTWDEFKSVYERAWQLGCKGLTTFNPKGKRRGVLKEKSCHIDPTTGNKTCDM